MLPALVEAVPGLLKQQDAKTGKFGSGVWIAGDQNVIYPLAAAWSIKDRANPFYHDPKLLRAIMDGGDVLVGAQGKDGKWMFRKKDNSTWGLHFDPWTYSRWVRTYSLISEAMPADRRARWEKALTLGYSGIARSALVRVQNIPAHHAMGLYIAGKSLNHPEWCTKASEYLVQVANAQDPNGFWTEHSGPVVTYNLVYVDALGIYYALSHDEKVFKALERATTFHANFIYPDGTHIETIDERVPYSTSPHLAGPGLSFTDEGRGYLRDQWDRTKQSKSFSVIDTITSMLLYGKQGAVHSISAQKENSVFVTGDSKAAVVRDGPWCTVLSAYACPVDTSRWIQDRQNFVSLFHEKTGLILGGGNTKLQPLWSTFTVGDTQLLKHKAGDKNPNFKVPAGLLHVPTAATLDANKTLVNLQYGDVPCSVTVNLLKSNKARVVYTAHVVHDTPRVEGHATFISVVSKNWRTASGKTGSMEKPFELTAAEAGPWFEHNGWRIQIPKGSYLTWPVLRHNPYRDDGRADLSDGRIVLTLPFSEETATHSVEIEILQ